MNLRTKYKITGAEYDELRENQAHRCAICDTHEDDIKPPGRGRPRADGMPSAEPFKLVVDHCHATGKIRGLLCSPCNTAIGGLRDSPALLRAAADYCERNAT